MSFRSLLTRPRTQVSGPAEPCSVPGHQARIASVAVRALDCGLHVDVNEDHAVPRLQTHAIHASARFTAILEQTRPGSDGAAQWVTALSIRSDDAGLRPGHFGHATAGLTLGAPPLSSLLDQAPAPEGSRVRLLSATWSDLVVTDAESGLALEVEGEWMVYCAAEQRELRVPIDQLA